MSHVTHGCVTYEWSRYVSRWCRVTYSYVTWLIHMSRDLFICVWRESFIRNAFICVSRDSCVCDVTHLCVTWLIDVTHWRDSLTWLIDTWRFHVFDTWTWPLSVPTALPPIYLLVMWHDSFISVWRDSFISVWRDSFISVWRDSFIFVWRDWFIFDAFICVTWPLSAPTF